VRRHQYNSSFDVLHLGIFNTTKPPSVIGAEVEIYASGTWSFGPAGGDAPLILGAFRDLWEITDNS
jgi:hypothetical protein